MARGTCTIQVIEHGLEQAKAFLRSLLVVVLDVHTDAIKTRSKVFYLCIWKRQYRFIRVWGVHGQFTKIVPIIFVPYLGHFFLMTFYTCFAHFSNVLKNSRHVPGIKGSSYFSTVP